MPSTRRSPCFKLDRIFSVSAFSWFLSTHFVIENQKEINQLKMAKKKYNRNKQKKGCTLTGSRRRSSVSRRAVRGFGCTSSLHSLSEAGGDSARSGKSSRVLGPRKRILSRRFSMVNTAHLGFTLTWWTATLWTQRAQQFKGGQKYLNGFSILVLVACKLTNQKKKKKSLPAYIAHLGAHTSGKPATLSCCEWQFNQHDCLRVDTPVTVKSVLTISTWWCSSSKRSSVI